MVPDPQVYVDIAGVSGAIEDAGKGWTMVET